MRIFNGFVASACLAIGVTTSWADDASRIRYTPDESQSAPPGGQLGTAGKYRERNYACSPAILNRQVFTPS